MAARFSAADLERVLLQRLEAEPGQSVGELHRALARTGPRVRVPQSTIRTRLRSLEARGQVAKAHDGHEWRYSPTKGLAQGDAYRFALLGGHTFLAITLVKRDSWTLDELHAEAPRLGSKSKLARDLVRFKVAELVQGAVAPAGQRFQATPLLRSILRKQGADVPFGPGERKPPSSPSLVLLVLQAPLA